MRVSTWNVNSIRQRRTQFVDWLDLRRPDVVCLQETKVSDTDFANLLDVDLSERGYEYSHTGEGGRNGVALLSRVGLDDVASGLAGSQGRAVMATCAGVSFHSLYVPSGPGDASPKHRYRLEWLAALCELVATGPDTVVLAGNLNVSPSLLDVYGPEAFEVGVAATEEEAAVALRLTSLGLHDVVRQRWPDERVFTYWDYRAGMFHKNLGVRYDIILSGAPVAQRVCAAWVDRGARKGSRPSDHAPVLMDLDVAPDGDLGPMVPPPSGAR
ncbi:exodeoxyribonuclease III [Rhodococcus sp. 15-649-2-2]|nr:exodeoxyribonuclease III [Rhodococcus sp. 15-649-2-2]